MAENRFPCGGASRETVCIEADRVLDSCRDRDCYENVRVFLSDLGNEILEHVGAVRAKSAEILWTNIGIDPIRFNRGFYAVTVRFYIKVVCEACVGGGRAQDIDGIAVLEKRVILYGGETNTRIYRSDGCGDSFCSIPKPNCGARSVPTAVVEAVDPVLLGTRILEKREECNCCCCRESDLPESLTTSFDSPICFDPANDRARRFLTVSLGIFSVVRITRPSQYLISASEYAIPEKECHEVDDDDPCRAFRSMPFPVGEFTGGSAPTPPRSICGGCNETPHRCGS